MPIDSPVANVDTGTFDQFPDGMANLWSEAFGETVAQWHAPISTLRLVRPAPDF